MDSILCEAVEKVLTVNVGYLAFPESDESHTSDSAMTLSASSVGTVVLPAECTGGGPIMSACDDISSDILFVQPEGTYPTA
jgi:hypothetical protein